jgi:hypothetical protein
MAAEFSAVAHAMEASLATGRTIEGSALDGATLAASLVTTGRFADPFGYPSGLTAHVGMLTPVPSALTLATPASSPSGSLPNSSSEMTGTKSELRFEPLPSNDPRQRRPDISEAELPLGLEPKTQLREGLTKTIAYFANILRKDVSTPVSASHFVSA